MPLARTVDIAFQFDSNKSVEAELHFRTFSLLDRHPLFVAQDDSS